MQARIAAPIKVRLEVKTGTGSDAADGSCQQDRSFKMQAVAYREARSPIADR